MANPLEYRTEQIFEVKPAVSTKNLFARISIPQHPQMADNNFNSAHQDSLGSESVGGPDTGMTGPTGKNLKLIKQYQPYGLAGIMTCNKANQFICVCGKGIFRLVVLDVDCNIISVTEFGILHNLSFAGGYFYLDASDNSIICKSNTIVSYPTANVEVKSKVYSLTHNWESDDIVKLVTNSATGNYLYSSLPVWGQPNIYWVLLAGNYQLSAGVLNSNAHLALVEIVPDESVPIRKCRTTLLDKHEFVNQWNNNSVSTDEDGFYFVLNAMENSTTPANYGTLQCFEYVANTKQMNQKWVHKYESCGYLLTGQSNIGSGTTPTVSITESGVKIVSITDNAAPQINVVVVNQSTGHLISKTPVFPKMRGCDEASLIGVRDKIVVENNYGHTYGFPHSQLVSNEPGMELITVDPSGTGQPGEVVWNNSYTTFFGMSQLARESGIIFAFSGSWFDTISSTQGAEYSIVAMDSFSGRIIWRIPIGRGSDYCHEYGGIYFDRSGKNIVVGCNGYFVAIQDVADPEKRKFWTRSS